MFVLSAYVSTNGFHVRLWALTLSSSVRSYITFLYSSPRLEGLLDCNELGKSILKLESLALDFLLDYDDFVVSGQENGVAKIQIFIGLLRISVATAGMFHPNCLDLPESDWSSCPRLACLSESRLMRMLSCVSAGSWAFLNDECNAEMLNETID